MIGQSIGKNSLVLAIFALVTAAVLAGTFLLTADRIDEARRKAEEKALFELVPQTRHNNDILTDIAILSEDESAELGLSGEQKIHIARMNNQPIAYIYPSRAPDGYSGDIDMIIGINTDGTLAGVRVLSHKETPGLGDKVDLKKSQWILGFEGKSLTNPLADGWKVKKDGGDFDQFTGATITPRAVVKRVKSTLEFHQTSQAKNHENEQL